MKRKNRRLWWSIPVLVLIAATSAAFLVNGKCRPVRVKVTSPQVGTVEEIITASSVGTVESRRTATVSAETSGRVLSIKVRPGRKQESHAPSGAPIVLIDESDIVAEQDIIRRNIQTQRLRRERAQLRIKQVETEYDRLKNTDETLRALDKLRIASLRPH